MQRSLNRRDFLKFTGASALALAASGIEIATAQSNVAATYSQTVYVRNPSGVGLLGARVSIDDGRMCYSPAATNFAGGVTFNSNGIRSMLIRCNGYADYSYTVNQSAYAYNVYLSPIPTVRQNKLLYATSVIRSDFVSMLQSFSPVRSLGTYSLGTMSTVLGWAGVGSTAICGVFPLMAAAPAPEPCKIAVLLDVASAATFVAGQLGVPSTKKFSFYSVNTYGLFPVPLVFMWPN